jgi:hypothetical protein
MYASSSIFAVADAQLHLQPALMRDLDLALSLQMVYFQMSILHLCVLYLSFCFPETISANFDYASIHGNPMGGCSDSSEDEESAPAFFSGR